MTRTSQETLTTYVGDMHALVNHGIEAIGRQVENLKDKGHPEAFAAVKDFHQMLQAQSTVLEARVQALGGSTTKPVKDAVAAVAGFAAGLINAVRPEEASKSIRDDYTFLSHTAIGYLMLHTSAASLGDRETVQIAEKGYREAARMVMRIDNIMPMLVLEELRQDGLKVADVSDESRRLIKNSWEREAKSAGFAGTSRATTM